MLNGIIVIDKDKGMTSADVVYHLRKALHIKKIGHAGTLDPEVTGVLPIAIGQATKLIELMHTRPKAYTGSGLFGYATDSYDTDGKTLKEDKLDHPFTKDEIQSAMHTFEGKIVQVPPIYSAVKVNGKRLYEYAREGIEVERPKREVEVTKYELINKPKFDPQTCYQKFDFNIECSKGTYVRSLVNDLGEKLNYPAVIKYPAWRRTRTVRTLMTVEFGTMRHRSSVLTVSLNRALESFSFGNSRCINLIACCEDICFNLIS